MKQYFVYILKCSDISYYTGITSYLEGRLVKHQSGYYPESYTHIRRPVELVFYTEFNDVDQAISFENKSKVGVEKRKKPLLKIIGIYYQNYQFVKMKLIQRILKKIK